MIAPRKDIARLQSTFYRDQYHKLMNILIVCMLIMFGLVAAIIYDVLHKAPLSYYANTTEGEILDMPPQG